MSRVPQGSILGLIYFIVFIDDIFKYLNVKYLLYADYPNIFTEVMLCHCNMVSYFSTINNYYFIPYTNKLNNILTEYTVFKFPVE